MVFFFLGQACTVVIEPEEEVGIVVLLRLRLDTQPGFPDLDWHCHDVQVRRSSEDPEVEVFPCHKWIRTADGNVELRNAKGELFLFSPFLHTYSFGNNIIFISCISYQHLLMFPFSSVSKTEGNISNPNQSQGEGSPTKTTVYQVKFNLFLSSHLFLSQLIMMLFFICRWGTFVEGGPHCADMTSVTALGPNLSYIRQR